MRRRCSRAIRKQAIYAAIEAEHAQREAARRSITPDERPSQDIAKDAALVLKA